MVESARLESGCTLQWCTEGSNPSHSATDMTRPYALLRKDRIRLTPKGRAASIAVKEQAGV